MKQEQSDREMSGMDRETWIIEKLRASGCRVTRQRRMLLRVILSSECSSCKEIYYKASELDPGIGFATVYRMINTLEEIGAIDRKNMYRINCQENNGGEEEQCVVELTDHTVKRIPAEKWKQIIQEGLKACGFIEAGDTVNNVMTD